MALQGFAKRKIGFYIDGKMLFNGLKKSEYLRKRGYSILYSGDFSSKGYDVYKICFSSSSKLAYLHLRFEFGQIDEIYYFIPGGNERALLSELDSALQKLKP